MIGALIVITAVLLGLIVGASNGLDGLQTALAIALAWIMLSTLYHSVVALLPRHRRRR